MKGTNLISKYVGFGFWQDLCHSKFEKYRKTMKGSDSIRKLGGFSL